MKAVIDLKKLRSDVQSYQVPVPGTSVGGPTASNLDVANRVAKAMSDAIKKCGGKTVKELY
jgi:hypothetical protein